MELIEEREDNKNHLIGIAGGASGGDILFHELCMEANIPSKIYLALSKEDYKKASVSFAGKSWEASFEELTSKLPVKILSEDKRQQKTAFGNAPTYGCSMRRLKPGALQISGS